MADGDELKLNTPFGPIVARGTTIFIVLALAALTYFVFIENRARQHEHEDIVGKVEYASCLSRLALYQNTLALKGEHIDFSKMPIDLYYCMPKFLTEGKNR